MENARIVTLSPNTSVTKVSTFEEAFGGEQHSELFGKKGREKRQARKLDKIEKKRERKAAKHEAKSERQENRGERKAGRQVRRQVRKSTRQDNRGLRKSNKQEFRQVRKDTRKIRRVARKAIGEPTEAEGQSFEQETQYQEPQYQEQGYTNESSAAPEQQYEEPQYQDEPQYEEEGYAQEGEPQYEDNYSEDEEWGGGAPSDYDEEEEYEEESDYAFDGVMNDSELNANSIKVNPQVADVAKKIEWNKELVSRLRVQEAEAKGRNAETASIQKAINERIDRIALLENKLKSYSNCEGEYSGADGQIRGQRMREVNKAKHLAKKERRTIAGKRKSKSGGGVTPVESQLNPVFSSQRIEIPAEGKSGFNGSGTGYTNADDADAPPMRTIELSSNASGNNININWKGVAIGVGIAAIAIIVMKKYKVLSK